MNIAEITEAELNAKNIELENQKMAIRKQQLEINQELTRRALRARLEKNKAELAAAGVPAQVINMIGIESAEAVGK